MIAKLGKGAGFGGCAKYDLDQGKKNGKDARLLDSKGVPLKVDKNGNLTANDNDIGRAFRAQAQALNPGVKKPVGRIMLSFDPKDTPKLTDAYMVRIAQEYMERMGITNTQYTIVRHSEKPHQHVHIIYNRVDNDGKIISDSNNFARSRDICKDITQREGLTWGKSKVQSKSVPNDPTEKLRYETAKIVHQCVKRVGSLAQLPQETAKYVITTHIKTNPNTGKPNGISFSVTDAAGMEHHFKGSELDRSLSIGNIQKEMDGNRGFQEREAEADIMGKDVREESNEPSTGEQIADFIISIIPTERSRHYEDDKIMNQAKRGHHR